MSRTNFFQSEMIKFGVYVLLPVAAMYVFSLPEVQEKVFTKHETLSSFTPEKNALNKIPRTMEGVRERTKVMEEKAKEARRS